MTTQIALPLCGCRILIVDDSRTGLAWSTFLRTDGGATVDLVSNARQARRRLGLVETLEERKPLPDIILLDFQLPGGVSGSQLASDIRAVPQLTHVVRICVSGHELDDVLRGVSHPDTLYHGYIQKGSDPSSFVSTIATYFITCQQKSANASTR